MLSVASAAARVMLFMFDLVVQQPYDEHQNFHDSELRPEDI
jgi:hypothetical protein